MPGDKNIVGSRVRKLRAELGLTQEQLSARLARHGIEIDRAGMAKIENGLRRVYDYELKGLAKVLKVSADSLLGER